VELCRQTFGIELERIAGEWFTCGNTILLELERVIHQIHRFQCRDQLRLEASPWIGALVATPAPHGWVRGSFDQLGVERPLQLLRERVIDAWFCDCRQDLPEGADQHWAIFDLGHLPLWLMGDPHHPLAGVQGLERCDLDRFPSLALLPGLYPRTESILRAQGLWNEPLRLRRYDPSSWERCSADQATLCYGSSFGQVLHPTQVRLPWELHCRCQLGVVVPRELAGHEAILDLLACLRQRLVQIQPEHPSLELVR